MQTKTGSYHYISKSSADIISKVINASLNICFINATFLLSVFFLWAGLGIYVVEKGAGDLPEIGRNVSVNYHGMLTNGNVFDSSFDRGQPFNFHLGTGRVIQGWDEGIAKLPIGSKAVLIIPANLGYGERAMPNIPANSTLVFDVEVLGNF